MRGTVGLVMTMPGRGEPPLFGVKTENMGHSLYQEIVYTKVFGVKNLFSLPQTLLGFRFRTARRPYTCPPSSFQHPVVLLGLFPYPFTHYLFHGLG